MAFRAIFVFLVPFIFAVNVQAEDIQLNPAHPQQYTVVDGDTLWGISARFLANPWQWPQVWHNNSQIKNPHLIFPGDTVYLSYVEGRPQLSLSGGSSGIDGSFDMGSTIGSFQPKIREIAITEAVKSIPIDVIAPFLTSPKVVTATELDESPYVVSMVDEHLIAGAGDQIYVRAIERPDSLTYTVFRSGETYINSITKEVLGYEAVYIGETTIQAAGDPARLLVTQVNSEIRIGDRLIANPDNEVTINFFPRAPEDDIKGSIIRVLGGVNQVGQFQVVVIDQGIRDGMESGHVLEIFRRGEVVSDPYSKIDNGAVKLPDETAGLLMIFRTFERVSYALVMEATRAIRVLDKVQTP